MQTVHFIAVCSFDDPQVGGGLAQLDNLFEPLQDDGLCIDDAAVRNAILYKEHPGRATCNVTMILIVDHDVSFLELASKILNRDRKVFLAIDSKQAFQLAEYLGFSVAFVDLDLKGEAGLSLIQKLRENFHDLAVIAVSTQLGTPGIEKAKKLGISKVLQNPITPEWKPVVEQVRSRRASQAEHGG